MQHPTVASVTGSENVSADVAAHLNRHTVHGSRGEGAQSQQRCEDTGTRLGVRDRSDRAQCSCKSHVDEFNELVCDWLPVYGQT